MTDSTTSSSSETLTNVKTRSTFVRLDTNWKYVNVGMVCNWKVLKVPNLVKIAVKINEVLVYPSEVTDDHFIFDFGSLRKSWFEMLGNTSRECDLLALEDACMYAQLTALHHYSQSPKDVLRGSIFTEDMSIFFVPEWKPRTKDHPNKLEIVEEHVVSDIHKQTYKE